MLNEILKINMLYDFYGELLTKKQREILRLYYEENLSLGEISKEYDVTRQGIHETIKRTEKKLISFEDKLKLWEKHTNKERRIADIRKEWERLKESQDINKDILQALDKFIEDMEVLI